MFIDIEEQWRPSCRKPAVGIDFGTTYCVAALHDGASTRVLEGPEGCRLLPSVVVKQGKEMRSFKRRLGREAEAFPLAVSLFEAVQCHITQALGYPMTSAVVTVPAYFDEVQRQAVKKAAEEAGFEVLRLLAEPTAAGLAYGLESETQGLYGVYDLGGGTFDFSLLALDHTFFQVLATGGDTELGGDDIDAAIAERLSLSDIQEARLLKEHFCKGRGGGALTEDILEEAMHPLIQRTLEISATTVEEAGHTLSQLKGIILVGGSTRSPIVQKAVASFFQKVPLQTLNPDEAVAIGAALHAYNLTEKTSFLLLDVCPLSLGIETFGGLVERLIPRHSPLPATASYQFTTAETGQTKIRLHVVQGEREMAEECRSLGVFEMSGIPPLPKGQARIRITFMLDTEGLLTLSAEEETTGQEVRHRLRPYQGLTDQDLLTQDYAKESESGEDVVRRLWIQKAQQAKEALEESQRLMIDYGFLYSEEEKQIWKQQCIALEEALKEADYLKLSEEFQGFTPIFATYVEKHLSYRLKKHLNDSSF